MSLLGEAACETAGTGTTWIGWNDQNARCSGVMTYVGNVGVATAGQTAPAFTHSVNASISDVFRRPPFGIFSAVVTGVARPFREPGIQANDPPPLPTSGTIPPIPRWDFNPELFQVDFDAIGGTLLALNTGTDSFEAGKMNRALADPNRVQAMVELFAIPFDAVDGFKLQPAPAGEAVVQGSA